MQKQPAITYRIRGSYPNYYILNLFVQKGWREFEKDREPEGNKPGTVIYTLENEKEEKEIAPRWYDVYYMLRNTGEDVTRFLLLLIEEEKGNEVAKSSLEKIRKDFYVQCKKYVESHPLHDTDKVTSALSKENYNVYEISHKGVMLTDLMRAGYAVPDFTILTSKVFEEAQKQQRETETQLRQRVYLKEAIQNLEIMTGCRLGAMRKPLIVALRSTMPQYIPGLMPTILNAGTTRSSYRGLLRDYKENMATRIYWNNLMNLYRMLFDKVCLYETKINEKEIGECKELISVVEKEIETHPKGKIILEDAFEQLYAYFSYIRQFYQNNQDLLVTFMQGKLAYPSLILQKMVWTIGDDYSYPGVLYSRHSRTGLGVQIESYRDIFGEEIMTGNLSSEDYEYFDRAQIRKTFPAVYHFDPLLPKLEKRVGSPVTIEFGAEYIPDKANLFAVLQINESELTGRAALLSSIQLYKQGLISRERVGELVRPYHRRQIFSERIDDSSLGSLKFFGKGVNVLPRSAVSAVLCFSTAKALEIKRKNATKVCLCKERFLPEDTIVLSEMDAIIGMTPAAIHVVTACRGYGIPAFLSLQKYGIRMEGQALINAEGMCIYELDWVTLSSKTASIYKGQAKFRRARFSDYLSGVKLEMDEKEQKVFEQMKIAYEEYTKIIGTIAVPDIVDLNKLTRLIRNDLMKKPKEARTFVNDWFDSNSDKYVCQLMESTMGSHQDQYRVYDLLSLNRKIKIFHKAVDLCLSFHRSGLDAGSFMLGRFLALPMSVEFWKEFSPLEIAFMLNEYVLYEKYLNVLYEVGEQQINKAKAKILGDEINNIETRIYNVDHLVSLKLSKPQWGLIAQSLCDLYNLQKDTLVLVEKLKRKYGQLFVYNQAWSLQKLQEICQREKCDLPSEEDS